jgi:hypothetical protein
MTSGCYKFGKGVIGRGGGGGGQSRMHGGFWRGVGVGLSWAETTATLIAKINNIQRCNRERLNFIFGERSRR